MSSSGVAVLVMSPGVGGVATAMCSASANAWVKLYWTGALMSRERRRSSRFQFLNSGRRCDRDCPSQFVVLGDFSGGHVDWVDGVGFSAEEFFPVVCDWCEEDLSFNTVAQPLLRKPQFSERSLNDPESVVGSSAVCSSAVGAFNVAAFCSDEECELSEDVFGDVEVAEASGVADGLEGFAFVVGESVVDG